MDAAYWDFASWDNFRWGVYRPDWDNIILPSLKNLHVSDLDGFEQGFEDGFEQSWSSDLWNQIKKSLEEL